MDAKKAKVLSQNATCKGGAKNVAGKNLAMAHRWADLQKPFHSVAVLTIEVGWLKAISDFGIIGTRFGPF